MKRMLTRAPHHGAVFARILDTRRSSFKGRLTDTTNIIVGVPTPLRNAVKALDGNAEFGKFCRTVFSGASSVVVVAVVITGVASTHSCITAALSGGTTRHVSLALEGCGCVGRILAVLDMSCEGEGCLLPLHHCRVVEDRGPRSRRSAVLSLASRD